MFGKRLNLKSKLHFGSRQDDALGLPVSQCTCVGLEDWTGLDMDLRQTWADLTTQGSNPQSIVQFNRRRSSTAEVIPARVKQCPSQDLASKSGSRRCWYATNQSSDGSKYSHGHDAAHNPPTGHRLSRNQARSPPLRPAAYRNPHHLRRQCPAICLGNSLGAASRYAQCAATGKPQPHTEWETSSRPEAEWQGDPVERRTYPDEK